MPSLLTSEQSLKEAVASQLPVEDLPSMLAFGLRSYILGSRSRAFSPLMSPTPPPPPPADQIPEPCCCHQAPSHSSWIRLSLQKPLQQQPEALIISIQGWYP